MANNFTGPTLIVNTDGSVAGQASPAMTQSSTAAYAAGQTLNQTLVLQPGQSYAPNFGFSNLVINTTGPIQLLAAIGSNPTAINQVVNQQTTIDSAVSSFSVTNNGTAAVTVQMLIVIAPNTALPTTGVVTSVNSLTGNINIVAGPGINVSTAGQTITVTNTGVLTVNGESGNVSINASNLPGLATVASTGLYSDLIGAPAPYVLPVATATVLGGIMVGSGLSITQSGVLSVTPVTEPVTSVSGQTGAVVVEATDNGAPNSQSLIVNSGATTGDIILNRLAVAGSGLAISTADGVTTITSSGLEGAVLTVDGQSPNAQGNVVVQAVDNVGTGNSLIENSGATTGNLTFNKIYAGSNITVTPDTDGNLVIAGTVNQYTLPPATSTTLGGVTAGANVTISSTGVISVANPYVLYPATATYLGGVKIGANVSVTADGTISVAAPYVLPAATSTTLGGVTAGANVYISSDGVISVAPPYALPIATTSTLGGIIVGNNLSISNTGVLSATVDPYTLPDATTTTLGGVIVGSGLAVSSGILSATYTLPVATTTVLGGVMAGTGVVISPEGVISVASSYVLPIATASILGGVKIGANVNVAGDGTISVAAPYVLPIASATTLGGIMVGANLNIDEDGTLWADPPYDIVPATATVLGGVMIGANINVLPNGTISVAPPYVLPTASATVLGGVMVGNGLSINDGVLSATVTSVSEQVGAVVVKAIDNDVATGVTLIENSGATTGTIRLFRIVAGNNIAFSTDDAANIVINSTESYTLPVATTSTLGGVIVGSGLTVNENGLLSATAEPYTLPTATTTTLGGVIVGTGLTITEGVLAATAAEYTLPIATDLTLGGIIVGSGLTITGDGVLSSTAVEYTLPAATTTSLGGVIVGSGLAITEGVLSATESYTLPVATTSTLGGIIVGSGLSVTENGTLSATANTYTLPAATTSTLGGVIIGANITVSGDGEISVAAPYVLPIASGTVLGGVMVGNGLTISEGVLSATGSDYTLPAATTSTLGGIIVGSGLSIAANGTLSATAETYTLPDATTSTLGGVIVGSGLAISSGVLSVTETYTLPEATTTTLGGVIVGSGLEISSGVLSATGGSYTLPDATTTTLGGVIVGSGLLVSSGTISLNPADVVSPAQLAAAQYYDIQGGAAGVPTASQLILSHVAVRTITWNANFASSRGYASAAATDQATFTIAVNGTGIGTMTFAAGAQTASFTLTGSTVIAPGQVLDVIAPATADATLANVTLTLLGVAT
jgi:hypothetical protein